MISRRACVGILVGMTAACSASTSERPPNETSPNEISTLPDETVVPDAPPARIDTTVIGESVQGRPIEVWHRVDLPGATLAADDPSRLVVLVIGSIHGNEPAGLDVVDVLAQMPVDEIERAVASMRTDGAGERTTALDLWLMPTGNPDGIAAGTRHNARQVDLNRNFPQDWAPLQQPGDYEYAGTGPASEPETRAMMTFLDDLDPDLTVWFHQDAYRVAPSWRKDRNVRALYAYLTGLPLLAVEGGTYTGVAATWHRRTSGDISFIVELGGTLSAVEATMHARAVLGVTAAVPDS